MLLARWQVDGFSSKEKYVEVMAREFPSGHADPPTVYARWADQLTQARSGDQLVLLRNWALPSARWEGAPKALKAAREAVLCLGGYTLICSHPEHGWFGLHVTDPVSEGELTLFWAESEKLRALHQCDNAPPPPPTAPAATDSYPSAEQEVLDDFQATLKVVRREAMRVSRIENATCKYSSDVLHTLINRLAKRYGWTL